MSITYKGKEIASVIYKGKEISEMTYKGKVIALVTIDPNAWHFGDGAGGPHPTRNDWRGTFSTPAKQAEFEAITGTVYGNQFRNQPNLTSISLPKATIIGDGAFYDSPLTYINVRKVPKIIGYFAFYSVVNSYKTKIIINQHFDDSTIQSRAFRYGYLQMTFYWTNNDGSFVNTNYWYWGITHQHPTRNDWRGTFSTPAKQAEFEAITDIVKVGQFSDEDYLTGISLKNAKEIQYGTFEYCPLTYIDLRNVTLIGDNSFDEYGPFLAVVNASTTHVWLPAGADRHGVQFNSDKYKNYMFGAGKWNHITFHWV